MGTEFERSRFVKLCGMRNVQDGLGAVEAGADAIGLNLWPRSPRSVSLDVARDVATATRGQLSIVVVSVAPTTDDVKRWWDELAPDAIQVHGDVAADVADAITQRTRLMMGIGLANPTDRVRALEAPGEPVLVDHKTRTFGGSGQPADWTLAREVARERRTILAGGLHVENVAYAIEEVTPWGVDVASGIEGGGNGLPSANLMRDFVGAARRAFERIAAHV